MARFIESTVEEAALDWLADLGYAVKHGPDIAPAGAAAERAHFGEGVLLGRLRDAIARLRPAWVAGPEDQRALAIRDDVAFFQAVRGVLLKHTVTALPPDERLDHAVQQLVSNALAPAGVVDIFAAAGLPRPDLSILSDVFLAEIRGLPQRNLAVELLRKLLADEISTRSRKQLVQARSFAAVLEQAALLSEEWAGAAAA